MILKILFLINKITLKLIEKGNGFLKIVCHAIDLQFITSRDHWIHSCGTYKPFVGKLVNADGFRLAMAVPSEQVPSDWRYFNSCGLSRISQAKSQLEQAIGSVLNAKMGININENTLFESSYVQPHLLFQTFYSTQAEKRSN